jgi:hypothetical protein
VIRAFFVLGSIYVGKTIKIDLMQRAPREAAAARIIRTNIFTLQLSLL